MALISGVLFLVVMVLEMFSMLVRYFIVWGIALWAGAPSEMAQPIALAVASLPMILAFATLIGLRGGGSAHRWQLGARKPSSRESELVDAALTRLSERGARMPRRFYVIDSPTYDAATVGTTLFVHRELIYTPYLEAVLAHECGHLEGADGQLLLALQRFAVPGLHRIHDALHRMDLPAYAGVVMMIAGGWGQMVTGFAWRWYFRRRELYADRRAAKRGYKDQLIEYLQTHSLPLDIAAPFMRGRSHPYTEERIARLRSTG